MPFIGQIVAGRRVVIMMQWIFQPLRGLVQRVPHAVNGLLAQMSHVPVLGVVVAGEVEGPSGIARALLTSIVGEELDLVAAVGEET